MTLIKNNHVFQRNHKTTPTEPTTFWNKRLSIISRRKCFCRKNVNKNCRTKNKRYLILYLRYFSPAWQMYMSRTYFFFRYFSHNFTFIFIIFYKDKSVLLKKYRIKLDSIMEIISFLSNPKIWGQLRSLPLPVRQKNENIFNIIFAIFFSGLTNLC